MTAPTLLTSFQAQYLEERMTFAGQHWRFRQTTPGAPVLLALPGALGTGDIFYRTAAHFSARYNVVTVGYPECGDNPAMAEALAALLDRLACTEAIVLGSSLGGYLAQCFALAYPARVRLLVLGNTFRDPTSQQTRWPPAATFADTPAVTVLQEARARLLAGRADTAPAAELKATLLALVGTVQSAEGVKAQRLAVLRAMPLPAVALDRRKIAVLDDDQDPVIAPETRADLRQTYADCRHLCIADGGHYPSVLAPAAYHAALDTFLTEVLC